MFFGLIVIPGKEFKRVVDLGFTLTGAAAQGKGKSTLFVKSEHVTYALCTVDVDKQPQVTLTLHFTEGEEVCFFVEGTADVHLTGFHPLMELHDDELGAGLYGDDDDDDDDAGADDDNDDDDDSDNESGSDSGDDDGSPGGIQEISEAEAEKIVKDIMEAKAQKQAAVAPAAKAQPPKPALAAAAAVKLPPVAAKDVPTAAVAAVALGPDTKKVLWEQQKKEQQLKKLEAKNAPTKIVEPESKKRKAEGQPEGAPAAKKQTMQGGVVAEDLVVGSGAPVKGGKNIGVFYDGRLASNNKRFDSCLDGKPFTFRVGSGVIDGWSVGVLGMQVGGKRRLTIPSAMAYGPKGAPPDIPRNAALVFDIELKFIK